MIFHNHQQEISSASCNNNNNHHHNNGVIESAGTITDLFYCNGSNEKRIHTFILFCKAILHISSYFSKDSEILELIFFLENVSEAAANIAISLTPNSIAVCRPIYISFLPSVKANSGESSISALSFVLFLY